MGGDDLFVPPLECTSLEEKFQVNNHTMKNNKNNINDINKNVISGNGGDGGENYWGSERGAWDLGDLMEDVSSFPFLDFQVE